MYSKNQQEPLLSSLPFTRNSGLPPFTTRIVSYLPLQQEQWLTSLYNLNSGLPPFTTGLVAYGYFPLEQDQWLTCLCNRKSVLLTLTKGIVANLTFTIIEEILSRQNMNKAKILMSNVLLLQKQMFTSIYCIKLGNISVEGIEKKTIIGNMHFTLHYWQGTFYFTLLVVYILFNIIGSVHFTLHCWQCTFYFALLAVYIFLYIVGSVHFTLHYWQCAFYFTLLVVYLLLQWGSCYLIFSFMCMFCRSFFVLLYFFFWPLCCLFLFDIRIVITPVVSSTSSWQCTFYFALLVVYILFYILVVYILLYIVGSVHFTLHCWQCTFYFSLLVVFILLYIVGSVHFT